METIEDLQRQVEMLKEQIRVSDSSYEYYRNRCGELSEANARANLMIGDISNELGGIIERQRKGIAERLALTDEEIRGVRQIREYLKRGVDYPGEFDSYTLLLSIIDRRNNS